MSQKKPESKTKKEVAKLLNYDSAGEYNSSEEECDNSDSNTGGKKSGHKTDAHRTKSLAHSPEDFVGD
jgi:hypothetical protein